MSDISIKKGTAAIDGNNNISGNSFNTESKKFRATVLDIFLFESSRVEFFSEFSNNNFPIGTIKFQRTFSNIKLETEYYFAIPKNIYNNIYPVKGEQVDIFNEETYTAQNYIGSSVIVYQYANVASVWNSLENNIVPKEDFNVIDLNNTSKEYVKSQTGTVNNTKAIGANPVQAGNIKTIYPLSDNIIQGRGGSSIRMGTSDDSINEIPWIGEKNKPVIIIRNGQKILPKNSADVVFEDINEDGSSLYFLSNHKIFIEVACNNFESYGATVNNSDTTQIVETKNILPTQSMSVAQYDDVSIEDTISTYKPISSNTQPVVTNVEQDNISELPDNEDDLFLQTIQNEPVPITNGILASINNIPTLGRVNGGSSSSTTKIRNIQTANTSNTLNFNEYVGKITNSTQLTASTKAFLDLIALMEGTAGKGNMNGYNVYFKYIDAFKGFNDPNNLPPHPNIAVPFQYKERKSNTIKTDYSTAAGRYQFLYRSWVGINGSNKPMTKNNQDISAWKRMLLNVKQVDIESAVNDFGAFKKVVGGSSEKPDNRCLAGIWASLPSSFYGNTGYYNQNLQDGKSFEFLWARYQQILSKYK